MVASPPGLGLQYLHRLCGLIQEYAQVVHALFGTHTSPVGCVRTALRLKTVTSGP
jgi:hypothetical protein